MNHLLAIITTLGIFLSAGSSYAHADEEPKFITTEGTHKLFDGLIEVTVSEMDGMLNTLFKGDMRPVLRQYQAAEGIHQEKFKLVPISREPTRNLDVFR